MGQANSFWREGLTIEGTGTAKIIKKHSKAGPVEYLGEKAGVARTESILPTGPEAGTPDTRVFADLPDRQEITAPEAPAVREAGPVLESQVQP